MPEKIDINCDMGESLGVYKLGYDEEVIKYITSANIACGFHAGDPMWMRRTVRLAQTYGVAIGAHPSFPDLHGFGRRTMSVTPEEVQNDITYQIGALAAFTGHERLQHVKPHGAMYNIAAAGGDLAKAICQAVLDVDQDIVLVALAGSPLIQVVQEMGLRAAKEAFADRALNADGTLVPRSAPGAVIHEMQEVVERSVKIATEGKVRAITGEEIDINADTLSLHCDTPNAVDLAAAVRSSLEAAGVDIVPIGQLV